MNNLSPLVSVIIPTYNRADLISHAIQSVLNQTYRNIELIVVDDGSTDNTKDVVKGFNDLRIQYIYTENWGGPARPRNIGIRKAKGVYLAFCDADDYWVNNKLEIQLKHFSSTDIIGLGASSIYFGDLRYYRQQKVEEDVLLDFSSILVTDIAPLSSLIIKNNGVLFDESENFKFVEDLEFQLRLTLTSKKKIKLLAEPLIYYRKHSENKSQSATIMENAFGVYNKFKEYIPPEIYRLLIARQNISLGIKSLRCGSRAARRYFTVAARYSSGKMKYRSILFAILSSLPLVLTNKLLLLYYEAHNTKSLRI